MMPTVTVVLLSNEWEVQVCPVPPTATFKWERSHIPFPSKPGRPMATYTSELDGHTETVPALPDSKEWKEWELKMLAWDAACDELRREAVYVESDYSLDYGVLAWRRKGNDDWLSEPPTEWELPGAMDRHGVEEFEHKRLAFIQLELLEYQRDYDKLHTVMFPAGERSTAPVTDGEVGAVLQSFPVGDGISAGSLGTGSGASPQWDQNDGFRTGDVGSQRKASIARRLVFLFTGK